MVKIPVPLRWSTLIGLSRYHGGSMACGILPPKDCAVTRVEILLEIATRFDLDGIQVDFARHVPCLPVGRQWEMREHVTEFMRMVRTMLLDLAERRRRAASSLCTYSSLGGRMPYGRI